VGPKPGRLSVGARAARVTVRWPQGAFRGRSRLTVRHVAARGIVPGTAAVRVVATRNGKPLKAFRRALDIHFHAQRPGTRPAARAGQRWVRIRHMKSARLPKRWRMGWYRGESGRVHVRTRRPGTFGLVPKT
jgi:hypothetical protein